eukprot:6982181-Pyramimonas_sp.AAC.1
MLEFRPPAPPENVTPKLDVSKTESPEVLARSARRPFHPEWLLNVPGAEKLDPGARNIEKDIHLE